MSVQLIEQPPFTSLSKNQITFGFSAGKTEDANIYPTLHLNFGGEFSAGEIWGFSFINPDTGKETIIDFLATSTPIHNGIDLPDGSTFTSFTEFMDSLPQFFRANVVLARYYTIEKTGTSDILFTAKKAEKSLVPYNYNFNGSPGDPAETISGSYFQSEEENKKIAVKVFIEEEYNSNTFYEASYSFCSVNSSGELKMNIEDIIHAELLKNQLSALPQDNKVWKQNTNRKYYIEYALTLDNVQQNSFTSTIPKLAVLGGVSLQDAMIQDPINYLFAKKTFLSWQANNKTITQTEEEYISWYNYFGKEASIQLTTKIYFNDGTDSTHILPDYNITLSAQEIATFNVSFSKLGIISHETATKKIIKWELKLTEATLIQETGTKTFYLDRSHYQHSKDLIYLNSFSCPEVIHTRGLWKKGIEIKREFNSKILTQASTTINGQSFQYNQSSINNYLARTSFFTKKQAEAFEDLLIKGLVFSREKDDLYPLLLLGSKYAITEDSQLLHSFDLTLNQAVRKSSFSNLEKYPELTAIQDCGLKGYTIDLKNHTITAYGTLSVYNEYGIVVATAVWNTTDKNYILTTKITKQGNYRVETELTLVIGGTSVVIPYYVIHQQNNETLFVSFKTPPAGFSDFIIEAHSPTIVYVNNNNGAGETAHTILTTATILSVGPNKTKISLPCASSIKRLYDDSEEIDTLNLSLLKNTEEIDLQFSKISGHINLRDCNKLVNVQLAGSSLVTGITVGTAKDLILINLNTTALNLTNADILLRDLWNKRGIFDTTPKTINIAGNAIVIPAELQDLIDGTDVAGTGKYLADGLVQKGFTVTV